VLTNLGKHAEAEVQFRQAIALRRPLVDDFPAVPAYRDSLAGSHTNLGIVLTNLGKHAEAEVQFRQALISLKLAERYAKVPKQASHKEQILEIRNEHDKRLELVKSYGALAAALEGSPHDALARYLSLRSSDVDAAVASALSADARLIAIADAAAVADPEARAGQLGMAWAALADSLIGDERARVAALAADRLSQFLKDQDRSTSLRERLMLARMQTFGQSIVPRPVYPAAPRNPHQPLRRIIILADASGSMLNMFDLLRDDIRGLISVLQPVQSFNVLFFQDNGVVALNKTKLLLAVDGNKHAADDFLNKMFVRGETNPIPALELAFKLNPDVIYLFSGGDFGGPGNDAVVRFIRKSGQARRIPVTTVGLVNSESRGNPQDLEFVKVLQEISKETGGSYRLLDYRQPTRRRERHALLPATQPNPPAAPATPTTQAATRPAAG
jgi:tetratricopeptide (TPR) repeat protein